MEINGFQIEKLIFNFYLWVLINTFVVDKY
jgi:hypothetical protein